MECGVQFVMTPGQLLMLKLYVDNWDSQQLVYYVLDNSILCFNTLIL